jgi:hypothetical protein
MASAATHVADGTNYALKTKQLIQRVSQIPGHEDPLSITAMQNLTAMAYLYPIIPEFPPLDATLVVNGKSLSKWHTKVQAAAKTFNRADTFVYSAGDADPAAFVAVLRAGTSELVPGAAEFASDMVKAWIETANTYQAQRVSSAVLQMTNANATKADINALIKDPIALREFIASQRRGLIARLTEILYKVNHPDPKNMANPKELELLKQHSHWFPDQAMDDSEYMPNDGAVPYPMLFVEMIYMLRSAGAKNPVHAWKCFLMMAEIFHGNMKSQSARVAWGVLAAMGDYSYLDVNIGAVIRTYCSDEKRNIEPQVKIASPMGRGPLRIARLVQCCLGFDGPFSILNYPVATIIKELMKLRTLEDAIIENGGKAETINTEVTDLRIAFTIGWYFALDRTSIFCVITGRNDLAVPKILESITNLNMSAFEDCKPREWSLRKDITGLSDDAPAIGNVFKAFDTNQYDIGQVVDFLVKPGGASPARGKGVKPKTPTKAVGTLKEAPKAEPAKRAVIDAESIAQSFPATPTTSGTSSSAVGKPTIVQLPPTVDSTVKPNAPDLQSPFGQMGFVAAPTTETTTSFNIFDLDDIDDAFATAEEQDDNEEAGEDDNEGGSDPNEIGLTSTDV